MQLSEIFTAKRCAKFIEFIEFPTYILKCNIFFTTAIFAGSASTAHNSLKIMFQNFTFWCYPRYDACLPVLRIPFPE